MSHKKPLTRKDVFYFILFYLISMIIYRITFWVAYGGFKTSGVDQPSFFDFREFWASTGVDFLMRFLISIPIIYLFLALQARLTLWTSIAFHLVSGAVFVSLSTLISTYIKHSFGWVDAFGGSSYVWLFYMTTLFYIIQFSLVYLVIYIRKYTQEVEEKAILNQKMLESQLSTLKAQLNPHFLHNTFNSINAAIEPQNEKARELIIQLSDLFRLQNTIFKKEFITIEQELEFIKKYLDIIKIRFKEKLTIHFEIDKSIEQVRIPPMLLQPIIENAISHGIAPKIEASELTISIQRQADKVAFTISDTGVGIKDKKAIFEKGLGLNNTKIRLEKIYHTQLLISDNLPSGLIVSFVI